MNADLLPAKHIQPDDDKDQNVDVDEDDLDFADMPCTDDGDDSRWEAFVPDEDERDPEPEDGDFWFENAGTGKEVGVICEGLVVSL